MSRYSAVLAVASDSVFPVFVFFSDALCTSRVIEPSQFSTAWGHADADDRCKDDHDCDADADAPDADENNSFNDSGSH